MHTESKVVGVVYTNWKGETSIRHIVPIEIVFGSNEWHAEEQWLLVAFDVDKGAERTFALKDIHTWEGALRRAESAPAEPSGRPGFSADGGRAEKAHRAVLVSR